eukprot:TRINITY_DN6871_c0_g2_i1.p1 TRINITY_DN6871_c0_g2~~TRINITY_DN6871_c0_g2_i1.p1  ORF type:complete len:208 (+),score=-9.27 TRINITY_DN6871_c0_g2_i1:308-931(+)
MKFIMKYNLLSGYKQIQFVQERCFLNECIGTQLSFDFDYRFLHPFVQLNCQREWIFTNLYIIMFESNIIVVLYNQRRTQVIVIVLLLLFFKPQIRATVSSPQYPYIFSHFWEKWLKTQMFLILFKCAWVFQVERRSQNVQTVNSQHLIRSQAQQKDPQQAQEYWNRCHPDEKIRRFTRINSQRVFTFESYMFNIQTILCQNQRRRRG